MKLKIDFQQFPDLLLSDKVEHKINLNAVREAFGYERFDPRLLNWFIVRRVKQSTHNGAPITVYYISEQGKAGRPKKKEAVIDSRIPLVIEEGFIEGWIYDFLKDYPWSSVASIADYGKKKGYIEEGTNPDNHVRRRLQKMNVVRKAYNFGSGKYYFSPTWCYVYRLKNS